MMGASRELAELASSYNSGGLSNMRNRIINGAMVIDQRNAGASITINSTGAKFSVDRWYFQGENTDGVFTVQQSSIAPAGFTKSMLLTVTTADASVGSTQAYFFKQAIEGYNVADLGWGAAGASTVTLSFWVRSSLTGTFGGAILNGVANRSYPFTFVISSANTWEQKTVTIPGDTSGTWATENTAGLQVYFSVGMGSTYLGTAGAWAGATYLGATGQANLISTNGATFYITGVQLEKGSTATSFDVRPYGTELSLCQRYYYRMTSVGVASTFAVGFNDSTTSCVGTTFFPVTMRTAPSALEQTGTAGDYRVRFTAANSITCSAVPAIASVGATSYSVVTTFTVASGLTAGQGAFLQAVNATAYLGWSAEL
jgi:hypothetical protein